MLHIPTLSLITILTGFLISLGIFIVGRLYLERLRGAVYWGAATAVQSTGWLLIVLRGAVPGWASVWLANTLLILGGVLFYEALVYFSDLPARRYLAHVTATLVSLVFLVGQSSAFTLRAAAMSLGMGILLGLCTYTVLHIPPGRKRLPVSHILVGLGFGASALVLGLRLVSLFLFPSNFNWELALAIEKYLYCGVYLAMLSSSFGFMLMYTERLTYELHHMASHDLLTGIYNRRMLEERLQQELAAAQRSGAPLALLLFDIDHFKIINDSFGHASGDAALKTLAQVVKTHLRVYDIFGRYGGEEFLVILPDTRLPAACQVGERLLKALAAEKVTTPRGCFSLTISAGAVERLPRETNLEMLLERADCALYQAKQLGRNRLECAGELLTGEAVV